MKTGLQSLPKNTRPRSEVQGSSINPWTNHEPRNLAVHKALPRPDWLPESLWPFETFGLPVDGARLAVTDVGRGPVLLFVHTGLWSFIWRDVIARLVQDFRCVCLDSPGSGRSEGLPRDAIRLSDVSRAVAEIIVALALEDLTLIVHDLGGPAGIAGAARMAQRVRGIVAVNAFGWQPTGTFFRGMLSVVGSSFFRGFDLLTDFVPRVTSSSFGIGRHMDEASRRAFRAGIDKKGINAFHSYMHDARVCEELYKQADEALTGPFRNLPLATIFGERNDPLGFQPRWKSLFPAAHQVVVAKGNHFPMCDDPELVAETIRAWHRERVAPNLR